MYPDRVRVESNLHTSGHKLHSRKFHASSAASSLLLLLLCACVAMAGCGGAATFANSSTTSHGSAPTITSFAANPATDQGSGSTLTWATTGATSVAISPGTFTSTAATGSTSVSPTTTTTYTLTATNSSGSVTATATVTVNPAAGSPVISSFTATLATITQGSSSTLTWATTGATSVAISPGTFTSAAASGSTTVSPTTTTTYTLTATNASGSVTATATVTVNAAVSSLPIITSFTASSATITQGSSSTLTWATTGATSVAISPGTFTSTAASGSTTVSPATTTTYTLTATNASGSVTATATVTVNAAVSSLPIITSFTASPGTITQGSSSTLTWATTGATSVAISPGTFTSTTAGGSTSVSPTTTTTYTLTATNTAGSVTATVTVTVNAAVSKPVITSFTASPGTITQGSSSTLTWATTGATSVAISPGTFTSTAAGGSTSVSPTTTTTYTLTATNTAGSVTATVTVTVNAAVSKPVITSFTASPGTITQGSSSTLTWATTGATSIAITPGTFTSTAASGSTSVSPTTTTTYTLTATNTAGSVTATVTITVNAAVSKPVITSFTASPASINSGSSSTLSWATTGATSIAITPGTFTSTAASGSTAVSPTATTTYTLTATNPSGSVTATLKITIGTSGGTLEITTSSCPGGTQGTAYAGCTLTASGGTPPYTFSVSTSDSVPPLPEGMSLDASTGAITSALIGGQGTYTPEFIVTDSTNATATTDNISFSINGSNAFLANIFPSTSIFHHRVDAATTGLPVDSSPAAPIYSGYLSSTIKPFFGNTSNAPFPNGIPAIQVPYNQPPVSVSTTAYQSYYASGPIPAYAPIEGTSQSTGDRHVLVYQQAGGGNNPALYEMWVGIYEGGPWTDSSNALWSNVTTNNLTPQGNGTTDAAGLPVAPLIVNADEVIGTGTPTAPTGTVQHPIRFTLNNTLNYWVWPATSTSGVGSCSSSSGAISTQTQISQSAPPTSCTMTGPAGEIYRLKASVATPACAASSPQANIIITAMRDYGIILADNGDSGGLIGTPDARWNDADLSCLTSLTLSDFEPVNVSSLTVSNDSGATQ